MPLDVSRGQSSGIQCQHFVVEPLQAPLALFDQLGLEAGVPVTGDLQVTRPRLQLHGFGARAIAIVAMVTGLVGMSGIAEMRGQLGFQHPLDEPLCQLFQQPMRTENLLRGGIILK